MKKNLKNRILMDISKCSVWDYESLKKSYDILKSIDLLIIAINMCDWMSLELEDVTLKIRHLLDDLI